MLATSPQPLGASPPRHRFDAAVEFNKPLCREHFLLRFRVVSPFPPTEPGQFIQIGCRTPDVAQSFDELLGRDIQWRPGERPQLEQPELSGRLAMLRRPFSLAGRGDDERGTWIEIIHRVVGVGTAWLAELAAGDPVDFIGPLGNTFDLPVGKSMGLLVGGGVGLPPMFYLAEALRRAKWSAVAFVGALYRDLLAVTFEEGCEGPDRDGKPTLCAAEFSRLGYPTVVTTDDGSFGLPGRITTGLERHLRALPPADAARAVVFTCGPDPMMHAVAKLAAAHGVDCRVCVEQAMACGMGTCQSCVVRIEDSAKPQAATEAGRPWRYRLACTDGPVFDSKVVVW